MDEKKRGFWRWSRTEAEEQETPEKEDITVRNGGKEAEEEISQSADEKTVRYMDFAELSPRRGDRDDLTRKLDDIEPWESEIDPVAVVMQQSEEHLAKEVRASVEQKADLLLEPVGWLICIEGGDYGKYFPLKEGVNMIGRAQDMDVVLANDRAVSRNHHATVIYQEEGRLFMAQNGAAMKPVYVNDDMVLLPMRMRARDILCVGDTRLMLIPCCDETFSWKSCKKATE